MRHRIGLLIHDSYSDYAKELIEGISEFCKEKKYTLLVFPVGELGYNYSVFEYQRRAVAAFCTDKNIDGLVIAGSTQGNNISKEILVDYIKSFDTIPTVSLGIKIDNTPSILIDPRQGIEEIMDDLILNHKCKKFCLMGIRNESEEGSIRTKVFYDCIKKHNIKFDENDHLYGGFTYESAKAELIRYVQTFGKLDCDALVCLNDDMALACIDYCKENKIKIGKDILITGFDDIKRGAFIKPSLTSVNQQTSLQGYKAAEIIDKILNKKKVNNILNINTQSCFRQSCGCVKSKDLTTNYITAKKHAVSFTDTEKKSSVVEWIEKKNQLYKLNYFHYALQTKMTIEDLRKEVYKSISDFDIKVCAIVMYDKPVKQNSYFASFPLPEKALLLASFDNNNGYAQDPALPPISFNPRKQILPNNILTHSDKRIYVSALFNNETQYGYIVYEQGEYEDLVYEMMCNILATILSSAYENTKLQERNTQLQEKNKELSLRSTTDELTGLLNRRGIMELGQTIIDNSINSNIKGLVIFGDMDGLKFINDTLGHAIGDIAIKTQANVLKASFRATDIVGRLGGDEFIIIAPGLPISIYKKIKENIDNKCKMINDTQTYDFDLSISLGCSEFNVKNKNLVEIMDKADSLLYEEKKKRKNARR